MESWEPLKERRQETQTKTKLPLYCSNSSTEAYDCIVVTEKVKVTNTHYSGWIYWACVFFVCLVKQNAKKPPQKTHKLNIFNPDEFISLQWTCMFIEQHNLWAGNTDRCCSALAMNTLINTNIHCTFIKSASGSKLDEQKIIFWWTDMSNQTLSCIPHCLNPFTFVDFFFCSFSWVYTEPSVVR